MNKEEVHGLRQAIIDGKIDGSQYAGDCACLKGTLAKVKGCSVVKAGMVEDVSEPGEKWFLQFSPGMTPENSNALKLTLEWVDEFLIHLNRPARDGQPTTA